MTIQFICATELTQMMEKQQERLNQLVKIEDGHIGFPEHGYWIELKQVKTHKKMVAWTEHLLQKEWISKRMMVEFLRKVGNHHGLNIYGC